MDHDNKNARIDNQIEGSNGPAPPQLGPCAHFRPSSTAQDDDCQLDEDLHDVSDRHKKNDDDDQTIRDHVRMML